MRMVALCTVWLAAACGQTTLDPGPHPKALDPGGKSGRTSADVQVDTKAFVPGDDAAVVGYDAGPPDPCIRTIPQAAIKFAAAVGNTGVRTIKVQNCGDVAFEITRIRWDPTWPLNPEFAFDFSALKDASVYVDTINGPTADKPVKLGAGEEASFDIRYTPTAVNPIHGATKEILLDEIPVLVQHTLGEPVAVLVQAYGVKKTCPTAKIVINEGVEVIPQTMLHLKGSQSKALDGKITKYKWTAKQPAGSYQVFVPGPTFPNPTFTANAAGDYEFCLDVWDEADQKSCSPACVTVLVLPEEAIHVELLWKTPADPDETDTGPAAGANMDLHFAHEKAHGKDLDCDGKGDPWFAMPWDTFWFNMNPNWGSPNPAVKDDPKLDVDDQDGAGPENLNLDDPEGTVGKPMRYAVGVHYWNDHGFKQSHATVNIYIMGVLALQISNVKMNVLDMWYVGDINWPNTMSQGVLQPFRICYQNGEPCLGGKRWLPKGDYCITPCYVPPAFAKAMNASGVCEKKP